MSNDATAEVLEAAADYLVSVGWIQGRSGDLGCPSCAYGAICEAIYALTDDDCNLRFTTVQVVQAHLGINDLPAWNDHPSRTAAEVIAALREASARVRTGEL